MKPTRSFLIALLTIALFALPAVAAKPDKPPAPDYQGQINALDAHVTALEAQLAALRASLFPQVAGGAQFTCALSGCGYRAIVNTRITPS